MTGGHGLLLLLNTLNRQLSEMLADLERQTDWPDVVLDDVLDADEVDDGV